MQILVHNPKENAITRDAFLEGIKKCWLECPYNIKFITADKVGVSSKTVINVDPILLFNFQLMQALRQIDDTIILLMRDQHVLVKAVDHMRLTTLIKHIEDCVHVGCIRLDPVATEAYYGWKYLGLVGYTTPNRLNLDPALWKASYLLKVLSHIRVNTLKDFSEKISIAGDELPHAVIGLEKSQLPVILHMKNTAI